MIGNLAVLLHQAVPLAGEAGESIMAVYGSDFLIDYKADHSPLTVADLAAHECLAAGLARLPGAYPVLSEESAEISFELRKPWETYWLIDPLDGTKEFVKRNGEFTVNIALIHRHKPVLGVVYAPVTRVCYFAAVGYGAYKQVGQGQPAPIAVRVPAASPPIVVGSRSHLTEALQVYLQRLGAHEMKSIGSSLKFCLVAEGAADLYPRLGPTSEWDTAAAQAVVECAGGSVVDLRGEALRYNTKASLLNPFFLVFGDDAVDWLEHAQGISNASVD